MHPSGVLAASPDGIVTKPPTVQAEPPTLVEVKCPYSARDMKVTDAATSLKGFFLGLYLHINFRSALRYGTLLPLFIC